MLLIAFPWAPEEVPRVLTKRSVLHTMSSSLPNTQFRDHFTDVGLEQFLVPVGLILLINFFSHRRKMK